MSWARVGLLVVVVVGATAAAGCSPFGGGAFSCTESAQCSPGGTCEVNGLCSFPDSTCTSGRRYGEGAGGLSGVCVGDEPPDAPPGTPDAPFDARSDARIDAPPGAPDAMVDAPPAAGFCDPADPTLRLCLEFEGTATDGSSSGNTPTTTSISYIAGQVGMAVALTGTSRIDIAETASLDVAHITIETWVNPTMLPNGASRVGIVDDNGEWGLFIRQNGNVQCTPAPGVTATAAVQSGAWTHVACTHDGTTLAIWVNGSIAVSAVAGGNIGTGGGDGTSIGGDSPPGPDRLTGALDQFRIFSEARSAAQICAAAGQAICP